MKTPLTQLRSDLAARLKAVRWGVIISRVSVGCGAFAGLGVYGHFLPVHYGVPFSTACLIAAGLCPRLQKAAGIVQSVQDGQTTLVQGVAEAWQVFVTARQEQALIKKAADLAPVMAKIEQLRTLQGDGPSADELAAGHEAIEAGHQAIDAAQETPTAPAVSGVVEVNAVAGVARNVESDHAAIDRTGGNQ